MMGLTGPQCPGARGRQAASHAAGLSSLTSPHSSRRLSMQTAKICWFEFSCATDWLGFLLLAGLPSQHNILHAVTDFSPGCTSPNVFYPSSAFNGPRFQGNISSLSTVCIWACNEVAALAGNSLMQAGFKEN